MHPTVTSQQYVVAVLIDGTLNVDGCGPFRSRERAEAVCARINDVGEAVEDESSLASAVAQVVPLQTEAAIIGFIREEND